MYPKTFYALSLFLIVACFCSANNERSLISNGSFEKEGPAGIPSQWQFTYVPGQGKIEVDRQISRTGKCSVKISTLASGTQVELVYPDLHLEPGWYKVRYSLRAPDGRSAVVQSWIGDGHSPGWHKVMDRWFDVEYEVEIKTKSSKLTVNPRYAQPWTFWIDDVSVVRIEKPNSSNPTTLKSTLTPAKKEDRRTLLFSPPNIVDIADNIQEWTKLGFDGFMIPYMPDDIYEDIWDIDGDPNSRDESDRLWREANRFNTICKANGMDSNFMCIGCYKKFPHWQDQTGWKSLIGRFVQNASFAKTTGFRGIALDSEYIAKDLRLLLGDENGKVKIVNGANNAESAYESFGYQMMKAMLGVWPQMDFIWIFDGTLYDCNLASGLFRGFVRAMAEKGNSQGIHVFEEWTYRETDPVKIAQNAQMIKRWFSGYFKDISLREYWERFGDIGVGLYPLGGGRRIEDEDWSDHRPNYDLPTFARVLAAARTYGGKYTWVYGHGTNWFRVTEEKLKKYAGKTAHPAYSHLKSDTGALCPQIQQYYDTVKNFYTFDIPDSHIEMRWGLE